MNSLDCPNSRVRVGGVLSAHNLILSTSSRVNGSFGLRGSSCAAMLRRAQRDGAISTMRQAADLDDASEKDVAAENKLIPIRALLGRSSGW